MCIKNNKEKEVLKMKASEVFKSVIEELETLIKCEHVPTNTVVESLTLTESNNSATITLFTNRGSFEFNIFDRVTEIRVEQDYLDINSSYPKSESFDTIMDGVLKDISYMFKRKNRLNEIYKKNGFFK